MLVGDKVYEGRTKILYNTADPDLYRLYFKDEATPLEEEGAIAEKGVYNAQISTILFTLSLRGWVPNHYREKIGERVLLVKSLSCPNHSGSQCGGRQFGPAWAWRRAFSFLNRWWSITIKGKGRITPSSTNPTSIPWDSYPLAAFRPAPYWLCKPTCF